MLKRNWWIFDAGIFVGLAAMLLFVVLTLSMRL